MLAANKEPSDSSDMDSFVNYSKTCATHSVHELDCYEMPSPIKEISVTTSQGKGSYTFSSFSSHVFL